MSKQPLNSVKAMEKNWQTDPTRKKRERVITDLSRRLFSHYTTFFPTQKGHENEDSPNGYTNPFLFFSSFFCAPFFVMTCALACACPTGSVANGAAGKAP